LKKFLERCEKRINSTQPLSIIIEFFFEILSLKFVLTTLRIKGKNHIYLFIHFQKNILNFSESKYWFILNSIIIPPEKIKIGIISFNCNGKKIKEGE